MNRVSEVKRQSPNTLFSHIKYEHFIAGISGGVCSTLVLHPLDLLKIRFAVDDGQLKTRPNYRSLGNAVSTIIRDEGIRGLYKGVTPNCWGAGASWGLFFLFYEPIKSYMAYSSDSKITLGPGSHMLAAALAGITTTFITNPIWVVKTRMCIQYQPSFSASSLPPSKHYNGMLDALTKIYRHEGIFGMYKGFVPGIFGVSHGALHFMAYEELKKMCNKFYHRPSDHKLTTVQYMLFSSLSKLFAASLTYPYQVLRVRLQDQHKEYVGVIEVVKRIWKFEGIKGYYKGIVPNLLRVTPATAITFVVYETMSDFLLKLTN
ncbi:solute carrier family 25 member 32 [Parasteatoda tepidariorum]|uniref:solute carrier family 25 member 32 n=1 Tax=Parasteatoda tepidariorum TaxID=114398 RepID=UPI001C726DB3|nr:mitochondrial folate transporter/carrier-like isoform X2 [Parasteatoda tepidariorum]